jgi:hypothetical protein
VVVLPPLLLPLRLCQRQTLQPASGQSWRVWLVCQEEQRGLQLLVPAVLFQLPRLGLHVSRWPAVRSQVPLGT